MENKNPLEDLRTEIIRSRSLGHLDEFTQAGVSGEILALCDALDSFYGIDRSPNSQSSNTRMPGLIGVLDQHYRSNSISYSVLNRRVGKQWNYSRTNTLIQKSKEPLASMREKLSKENQLYISISSVITSIALHDVVSSVNSYQEPKSTAISYYGQHSGFGYYYLIKESLEVIRSLKGFDMTEECKQHYEENRKTIEKISQEINDAIMQCGRESSTQAKSSGCMVFIIVLFASILSVGEIIGLL